MENIQSGAAMRGGGGGGATPPPAAPAPTPVPFGAPTQNPNEPVTAGAPLGPGVGPQAAGIEDDSTATLKQMAPLVNSLELVGNLPGATPEFRAFVRNLKARVQSL